MCNALGIVKLYLPMLIQPVWCYKDTSQGWIEFESLSSSQLSIWSQNWKERLMCVWHSRCILLRLASSSSIFHLYLIVSDRNYVFHTVVYFVLESICQLRVRDAKPPYSLHTSSTVGSLSWILHPSINNLTKTHWDWPSDSNFPVQRRLVSCEFFTSQHLNNTIVSGLCRRILWFFFCEHKFIGFGWAINSLRPSDAYMRQ